MKAKEINPPHLMQYNVWQFKYDEIHNSSHIEKVYKGDIFTMEEYDVKQPYVYFMYLSYS